MCKRILAGKDYCESRPAAHATLCCDGGNDDRWSRGEIATYTCQDGYEHTAGDLQRTCVKYFIIYSKWTGELPTCSGRVDTVYYYRS